MNQDAMRTVETLAVLKVGFDQHSSYIGGYLPFMYHCMRNLDTDQISAGALQSSLRAEFGLDMPRAVVHALLREAEGEGKVSEEHGTYVRVEEALVDCDLNPARKQFGASFNAIKARLVEFSESLGFAMDKERASQELIRYVDGFSSDVLAASMNGRPIPGRSPQELTEAQYVVHRFVSEHADAASADFEFLVGLVKARMLSDALYFDIATGQEDNLSRVDVYLDGPILLFLRGCAGGEIATPYVELLRLLLEQGANVKCFTHSIAEAQSILDAAAARKDTGLRGESFSGDVVRFLVKSDWSRSDIVLESEHLAQRLLELGVETVETPDRVENLQPDEEALEKLIAKYVRHSNRQALRRDVDSLTAIQRIRRGKRVRTLASARAVFVTHNYGLFKASTRFFDRGRSGHVVPQCVHYASFATVVWLQMPRAYPDLPREIVMADAMAARQPTDELWEKYNAVIEDLSAKGEIDAEDIKFLRLSEDAPALLMDLTRGRTDAFTSGTVAEIVERYHNNAISAEREKLHQVTSEKHALRELADKQDSRLKRIDEELEQRGRQLARWIASLIVAIPAIAAAVGLVLGPVGPVDRGALWIQVPCAVVAIAFTVWTLFLGGSVRDLRDALASRLLPVANALLTRIFPTLSE